MIALLLSLILDYGDAYREWTTGKPMVVMVSAKWCPACPGVERQIRAIDGRFSFTKIDFDSDRELVSEFGNVTQLPTTFIYVPGRPVVKFVGYDEPKLRNALRGFLKHERL